MPPKANKPKTVLERAKQLRAALKGLDEAGGTRLMWTAETQSEVAEFFDVSIDTVKNWAKQKMPGRPKEYRLDRIAVWLRTEGPGSKALKIATDDPLLAEGDSPALERYRLAKAKHAELDLEHRKGELIDVNKCRDILGQWASVIRKMGDRVSKRFGIEANLMVTDAIDACEDIVRAFDDGNN
jgi:phage terminase Nu1 subunit (DNA packaging protein)